MGFNVVLNFWVEAAWESENKGSLYFPTRGGRYCYELPLVLILIKEEIGKTLGLLSCLNILLEMLRLNCYISLAGYV